MYGQDLDVMRFSYISFTLGGVLIVLYQVITFVRLLKNPDVRAGQGYSGLIYTAIILMLPLGIGAAIYDYLEREKVSKLFVIAFLLSAISLCVAFIKMFPHMQNFNFNIGQ